MLDQRQRAVRPSDRGVRACENLFGKAVAPFVRRRLLEQRVSFAIQLRPIAQETIRLHERVQNVERGVASITERGQFPAPFFEQLMRFTRMPGEYAYCAFQPSKFLINDFKPAIMLRTQL